jgi:DNA helicase HerA-like ATPase
MSTATGQAWSLDGVGFRFRAPIGRDTRLGGYLALDTPDGARVGQVLAASAVEVDGRRMVEGQGRLVGRHVGVQPFEDSAVERAPQDLLAAALRGDATRLEVGTLGGGTDLPATIDARGFNRHTFLCGQSGSGKTYALGLLLERLVLGTRLPLLVLDPNGDHVHLGTTRDDVDPDTAAAYADAARDVRVLAAAPGEHGDKLRIRLAELGDEGAAALLQLDPVADPDEYNALLHALAAAGDGGFPSVQAAIDSFRASGDRMLDAARKRTENLGVLRMTVWAGQQTSSLADTWFRDRPRALVADTSGFEQRRERVAVAVATLHQLWQRRKERRPLLLVVDEAHDVCPAQPEDELQRLAVESFTRIAGEGRKYGIHLLLASQRPDKLPDNVLSQCDNLLLMRVNSVADRLALTQRFGYAPPGLVEVAGSFGLGETLVAGKLAPDPLLARIGRRITPEGGADVPTDWVG